MITTLLILSTFVMCVSHTLAKEVIFEWLRDLVKGKTRWRDTPRGFLGELVSCPYCLSHWVAFFTVWITGFRLPIPIRGDPTTLYAVLFHFFVTSIVVVAAAAVLRVAFYLVDEGQGLMRQENKIAKKEAES